MLVEEVLGNKVAQRGLECGTAEAPTVCLLLLLWRLKDLVGLRPEECSEHLKGKVHNEAGDRVDEQVLVLVVLIDHGD